MKFSSNLQKCSDYCLCVCGYTSVPFQLLCSYFEHRVEQWITREKNQTASNKEILFWNYAPLRTDTPPVHMVADCIHAKMDHILNIRKINIFSPWVVSSSYSSLSLVGMYLWFLYVSFAPSCSTWCKTRAFITYNSQLFLVLCASGTSSIGIGSLFSYFNDFCFSYPIFVLMVV